MFRVKKLLKKFKAVNRALFNSNYEDIKMTVNEINTRLDYFLHLENKLNTILSHLSDENSYINMNINTIRHGLSVPFWRQEIRANELISVLKPNIFLNLERVGNLNDGGYFVPTKLINKISLAVNIGIGDETSLDQDLLSKGFTIHAYDPYIESHPIQNTENIRFFKQGLSSSFPNLNIGMNEILSRVDNEIHGNDDCKKCLFIDIEGSEWEHFRDVNEVDLLSKFSFIVFEFHDLLRVISMAEDFQFAKVVQILKQITNNFDICHISGNNSSSALYFNNKIFPDVLELTLVNKSEIFPDMKRVSNNMPVSMNDPSRKPYDLNNWNY